MNQNQSVAPLTKPLLRGHFHQAAFFFAFGACAVLITHAHNTINLIAAFTYSLSLVGLFGVSALYHRLNWNPSKRSWMRKLDHAAIYILIAGTSTPICLLALNAHLGMKLLELVWGAAFFGIFQSLFWAHAPKWISAILYVIVGCLIIPYLGELRAALSESEMIFLYSGGAAYILGAIIYALKRPNPNPKIFGYHEIFHLLVMVGAFFHFLVILKLIA
jgi:hemolysin III